MLQNPHKYLFKQIPKIYKQLNLLRLADLKYQSLPPFKEEDKAYNLLAYLYVGYVYVVNQFISAVNHTINFDEKQELKLIIEKTVARILEIKAEMFALYKTDYPQIDNVLVKSRVTRREVDLKVPYYFKIERKQLLGNFYTFANKIEAGEIGVEPLKGRPIPEIHFNIKDYLKADKELQEIEAEEYKSAVDIDFNELLDSVKELVQDNEALNEYELESQNEEEQGDEDVSSDSQFSFVIDDEQDQDIEVLPDKAVKTEVTGPDKPIQKLPFDVVLSSSSSSPSPVSSLTAGKMIDGVFVNDEAADLSEKSLSMEELDKRRLEDLSSDDLSDYLDRGDNVKLEDKKIFAETYCDKLPKRMSPEDYHAAQTGEEKKEVVPEVKGELAEGEKVEDDASSQTETAKETEPASDQQTDATDSVAGDVEAKTEDTAELETSEIESEVPPSETEMRTDDEPEESVSDDDDESSDDESEESPKDAERRVRFNFESVDPGQLYTPEIFQGRPLRPPREFPEPKEFIGHSTKRDRDSSDGEECDTQSSLLSTESDGSLVNLIQSMEGNMRRARKYLKKVEGKIPSSEETEDSSDEAASGSKTRSKKSSAASSKKSKQKPTPSSKGNSEKKTTNKMKASSPTKKKIKRDRRLIKAPPESEASSDESQFDARHAPEATKEELLKSFFYLIDMDYNKDTLGQNGRSLLSLLKTIYLKRKSILGALGAQYKLPLLSLYGSHKFKPARDLIKMLKFKPELAPDAKFLKTDVELYSVHTSPPLHSNFFSQNLSIATFSLERELKKLKGELMTMAEKASSEFITDVPNEDFVSRVMTKLEDQLFSLLPSLKRAHNSDKAYLDLKNDITDYLITNKDDLFLETPQSSKFEEMLRQLSDNIAAGLRRIRSAFLHGFYKPSPRAEKKFCFEEKMVKTEYRLLNERIYEEINALEELIDYDMKRKMEMKEIEILDEVLEYMRSWHQSSKSQTTGWDLLPIPQLDHFKNRPPERLVGIPAGIEREFRDRRFPKMVIEDPLKITEQVLTGTAIIAENNLVPPEEFFYAKEWLFVKFLWLSMLDDKQKEAEAKKTTDALERLRKERDKALLEEEKKKAKQKQEGHLPWPSDYPVKIRYDVEDIIKRNKPLRDCQFVNTDDLEHDLFMKYYSKLKRQLDGLVVDYQQRVRLEMIKNHGPTFELEPEGSEIGDLLEKAEKPKKKEKPDLPDDVKFKLIHSLAKEGYFKRHAFVSMDHLIGEYSFSAFEYTNKYFIEGQPGWKDLYQVIKETCIFPLASKVVRARAPLVRSVLILGPSKITRPIVNAMTTDSGALMIYVDPLKPQDKKMSKKQLKDAITKVAKMAGPTIIFFEGIHNANLKKKKKFGKGVNPKYIKKLMPDLASKIDVGTQALVVATADEPWNTRGAAWTKGFDKVYPIPDLDMRTSEKFWQNRLLPRDYTNRYEIYHPLAKKTTGKQAIIPASEALKAVEKIRANDLEEAILFKHLTEPILNEHTLKSYWKWAHQKVPQCGERQEKLTSLLDDKGKAKGRG